MCSLQHGRRLKGHYKSKASFIGSMQAFYVQRKQQDSGLTPSTFFSWKERRAHGTLLGLPPGDIPGIDDEAPENEEVLGAVRLSSLGQAATGSSPHVCNGEATDEIKLYGASLAYLISLQDAYKAA